MVQVAIIRPGPIVGQMMNPYMERRQGRQKISYPHPLLEPVPHRTLGVSLFQEQLLRIAMIIANFTGGEAEELRRALGSPVRQTRCAHWSSSYGVEWIKTASVLLHRKRLFSYPQME